MSDLLQQSTTHVVLSYKNYKLKDGKKAVDLVPASWVSKDKGKWFTVFPGDDDYWDADELQQWIQTSHRPNKNWQKYPIEIISECLNFEQGERRIKRSFKTKNVETNKSGDSSDDTKKEKSIRKQLNQIPEFKETGSTKIPSSKKLATKTQTKPVKSSNVSIVHSSPKARSSNVVESPDVSMIKSSSKESFTKSGDKNYSFNSSRGSLGSTKENVSNSSERSNQTRSKLNASQLNKSSDKSHSQNDLRDAYANDSLYRNLSSSRSNNSQNSSSKNKTCDSSKVSDVTFHDLPDKKSKFPKKKVDRTASQTANSNKSRKRQKSSSIQLIESDAATSDCVSSNKKLKLNSKNSKEKRMKRKLGTENQSSGSSMCSPPPYKKSKQNSENQKGSDLTELFKARFDELFTRLENIEKCLQKLSEKLRRTKESLRFDIKRSCSTLSDLISANIVDAKDTVNEIKSTMSIEFPINDDTKFREFDQKLQDIEVCKKFKLLLKMKSQPYTTLKTAVSEVLAYLIAKPVQLLYSGVGKVQKGVGKKNFSATETFKCFSDVLCTKFDKTKNSEVVSLAGKWLSGATDRDGGKKEREANAFKTKCEENSHGTKEKCTTDEQNEKICHGEEKKVEERRHSTHREKGHRERNKSHRK